MSFSSLPKSEIPAYDPRTATRPQTTHAVVRLLQGIRRTEENTSVAHRAWRTDRIPHSREFLQGEAGTKESARHVFCGERGRSVISGTAQIITDRSEVARVYRSYWKSHPLRMAIVIGLRLWIEMLLNKRVVVRVQPDEPNPLAGLTDPVT